MLFKIILLLALFFASSILKMTGGQFVEWCIADEQALDDDLKKAVNWACGAGGADCSRIQPNQPCYNPNTLRNHASYVFNDYYQKYKHKGASCYFNAAAIITDKDPSHGSCKFKYLP